MDIGGPRPTPGNTPPRDETPEPSEEVEHPPAVNGRDVAVVAGTLALWTAIMALAARSQHLSIRATSTWGRWDTGHYLRIAEHGYAFGPCDGVANRGPGDYCGSSGWFPGYPYAMRASSKLGMELDDAGRLIAWSMLVVVVVALWFGFLRRRPAWPGLLGMALAASFPAGVYFGAIFPVSTMLAAALLALIALDRQRWLVAGSFVAVATVSYSSGIVLVLLALVPLISPVVGDMGRRCRAALAVGMPIAIAYGLVLLNFQRATGHWDAWFKTTRSYHLGATFPLEMIRRQIVHLGDDPIPAAVGVQTIVVLAMVILAGAVVVRDWSELSLGERGASVVTAGLWILPLCLGGDLSLYRAESLLLPIVILLTRLRPWMLGLLVLVAVPLSYRMAQLFFDATLM